MAAANLIPGVRKVLNDAAGVSAITTRVYPEFLPQDGILPAIILARVSNEQFETLETDAALTRAGVQINVYADTYEQAQNLAAEVHAALQDYYGAVTTTIGTITFQRIRCEGTTDLSELDGDHIVRRVLLDFFVTYSGGNYQ